MSERSLKPRSKAVLGAAFATGIVLLWQLTLVGTGANFTFLPTPVAIARGFAELIPTAAFWTSVGDTVSVVLMAWATAVVLGGVMGVLLGLSPVIAGWTSSSLEVVKTLPGVVFLPPAVLVFGFSTQTELVVAIFIAIWPMIVNSTAGVGLVSQRLRDVRRSFGLGSRAWLWKLVLPTASPSMFVGARLSLSLALVGTIVAEMAGNPRGLGWALVSAQQALQPAQMFDYIVVIGLAGIVLNQLVSRIATSAISPLRVAGMRGLL